MQRFVLAIENKKWMEGIRVENQITTIEEDFKMLYDAMFKRKSVRKYSEKPLSEEMLYKIKLYKNSLVRLFPDIETEFKIISRKEVTVTTITKAPHYVAVYSEEKEGYLTNIGFMLEQLDLFLSANNIGACWLGTGSAIKSVTTKPNLKFVILLAFGKSEETIHRKDVSEFNRKQPSEISNVDNELSQTIRLAPSAINGQPWYYNQNNNDIDVYIRKNNMIKNCRSGEG